MSALSLDKRKAINHRQGCLCGTTILTGSFSTEDSLMEPTSKIKGMLAWPKLSDNRDTCPAYMED